MVPGTEDPWSLYAEVCESPRVAACIGAELGRILAEQHSQVHIDDVADWLPRELDWPRPGSWIRRRLATVVDDQELLAEADVVLTAYESVAVAEPERALVHSDVGLHNLCFDRESHSVLGVFDYYEAAWADRHHDFRYLVPDEDRDELLGAALAVYEPAAGHTIQHDRVFLYNAACALSFLAFRAGKAAEERSCGRTLEQDLRWTRRAIARVVK
jgi:Ser/Thr protein kinase RdoA (MazF antagonist)